MGKTLKLTNREVQTLKNATEILRKISVDIKKPASLYVHDSLCVGDTKLLCDTMILLSWLYDANGFISYK